MRADSGGLMRRQLLRISHVGVASSRAGAAAVRRFCTAHVWQTVAGGVAVVAVGAGFLVGALTGSGSPAGRSAGLQPHRSAAPVDQRVIPPVTVTAAELARLPRATTYATVPAAPLDPSPFAVTGGLVVRPLAAEVVYAGPGREPVAVLPTTELGGPTWVPVVQVSPGWDRVLLPSRPNGATGWIYTATARPHVDIARSSYLVRIWVGARRLSLYDAGRTLGTWTVAVGAAGTPTPTGRTFVLSLLAPVHPTYSPLILPLGFHSNTLDTYGGGPGTVGLHGWPDASVFGRAVSHGCVRVPAGALTALSKVPLGTLVVITS